MVKANPVVPRRTPLVRFLLDNLGWMLVSLILALLVWYVAVSGENPVEERRFLQAIPISIRYDEGLLVVNRPPVQAQVTIRALQSVWNVLGADAIQVVADLTGRAPNTYTIDLEGELVDVRGGQIVSVQPRRITVQLERREEKRVNVVVAFTQEAPVGYVATPAPLAPTVLVSGPAPQVQRVESVEARVNPQDQRETFARTVTLVALDAGGEPVDGVTLDPPDMEIITTMQRRPDVYELVVDPRLSGELPPGYLRRNYTWSPRRVIVRGDDRLIQALEGVIRTEPIDLSGRTTSFTQTVRLALPAGVVMPDPTDITITVEIEPVLVSREFPNIPVQTQGLDPADYSIAVQPDRVNVIVRGPQAIIDSLTADEISVFAPLTGLQPGTNTVTLLAAVARPEIAPEGITLPIGQVEVNILARNPTPDLTTTATSSPTPSRTPASTPTLTPTPTP